MNLDPRTVVKAVGVVVVCAVAGVAVVAVVVLRRPFVDRDSFAESRPFDETYRLRQGLRPYASWGHL